MKKSSQTTVHTRIGHERAVCGLNPNRGVGTYKIVLFQEFFTAKKKDRCSRCLYLLGRHGYNIQRLEEQYEALKIHAQQQRNTPQPQPQQLAAF